MSSSPGWTWEAELLPIEFGLTDKGNAATTETDPADFDLDGD